MHQLYFGLSPLILRVALSPSTNTCALKVCSNRLTMAAGAATPLRDSAWAGGRTPMHPSQEGADGYDGYGPRGTTPSYAGGGYAGTPFNPSSDHSRHVSLACAL